MRRRAGWRRFSSEPLELGQPDVHQLADGLLEPDLGRDRERLCVGLPHFAEIHALFQTIVASDEESVDPLTCVVPLHIRTVSVQI